ncbi:MAG: hypothetical protein K8U57_38535 [Planctomycetes bacterium]|nr:hypothetical protein [Planctomycetota bacterium]
MREAMKQLWLVIRDNVTYWWLVSVCDCPQAMMVYLAAQEGFEKIQQEGISE